MISLEKYNDLKKKADKAKADAAKAEGALEQQMKKLKEEFSCDTLEGAEILLKTLKDSEGELEVVAADRLAAFEKQWGSLL